jgi:TPR repeat protein
MLLLCATPALADFEAGESAYKQIRLAAEQGDAGAQYILGVIYATGRGKPEDDREAVKWFRLAAEQGFAEAQYKLGFMYAQGRGVPADDREAAKWFRLAANQGHAGAQYNLGVAYATGRGVPADDREAAKWFRLAANQGDADAQYVLGVAYATGRGVPQDDQEAVKWWRLAAEQGLAQAQSKLSAMYALGRGVPQNYVQAHMWANLAGAQGENEAIKLRKELATRISPAQIAEAQRLARAWKPKGQGERGGTTSLDAGALREPLALRATGSGIRVSQVGYVLTNHHVVAGCAQVRVAPSVKSARVVALDATNDLALLKSERGDAAVFREGPALRQGEAVTVVGYPLRGLLASGPNVTNGIVSALAGPGNDTRLLQITAPVQPGNSGGPLLDSGGYVIGVVMGKLDALKVAVATGDIPQNVNFALRAAAAKAFLETNAVQYKTASSGSSRNTEAIADRAKQFTVLVECWK